MKKFSLLCEATKKKKDEAKHYDLVIVGGGPAGMSSAIQAASEGMKVAVLDASHRFGGQALSSRAIENYPGFPHGISGKRLLNRMLQQAHKFGVEMVPNAMASGLDTDEKGKHTLTTADGRKFSSHSVILAHGLAHNRIPQLETHLGRGVHYAMPDNMEKILSKGEGQEQNVVIVGGGNSAGQAADRLRKMPGVKVHVVVRSDIRNTMSDYALNRLAQANPNVKIHNGTEIEKCMGHKNVSHVKLNNGLTIPTNHVVMYAGAKPRTDWLRDKVETDEEGYIKTGHRVSGKPLTKSGRARLPLESSREGVFVAGDVRDAAIGRIAGAVGEGATALHSVHAHREQHPELQHLHQPSNYYQFSKSFERKVIPNKAPPLPKARRKPPKPTSHPNEGMQNRAKLIARVASSLSKKPEEKSKRTKIVKEVVEWLIH
jgi:thioredoxin reductase (NADPH)